MCLAGPPDRRTVTVLDTDGAVVGTRELGAVESLGTQVAGVGSVEGYTDEQSRRKLPTVRPAADGTLVVLEPGHGFVRAGSADQARRAIDALSPDALPVPRVVDAVSGEVRGSVTPRLASFADMAGCGGSSGDRQVDLQQPVVRVSGHLASISLCGAGALRVLASDGEPVTVPSSATASPVGSVQPVDGGLAIWSDSGATVVRADGAVDLPGLPLPVRADADPSDTVVATTPEGGLVGAGPDGAPRWTTPPDVDLSDWYQLARAAGTVVLAGADGAHVVIGMRRDDGYDLAAFDLASGRTVWESAYDGRPLAGLVARDGHAVAVLQDVGPSVRTGGDDEEGVATSDTVLQGLSTG